MMNWYFAWGSILAAFVTGAILGVFFYSEDFLGGYASFRRRILRLGHISLAALGMMNILYSQSSLAAEPSLRTTIASVAFVVGGVTMPGVCFLSAWRVGMRRWFFIPVVALIVAGIQVLRIGPP